MRVSSEVVGSCLETSIEGPLLGLKHKRTRYGGFHVADPEKGVIGLGLSRATHDSTIHSDELDLRRLGQNKLLRYASEFPGPVKQQILAGGRCL